MLRITPDQYADLQAKRSKKPVATERRPSEPERLLAAKLAASPLPPPEPEFRFHPIRRWRFDFAWPSRLVAVEIDGGIWTQGRHSRGAGVEADCEKYCEAAIRGWRILRFTPRMVKSGEAMTYITAALT